MKRLAAALFAAVACSLLGCSPKHPSKVVSLEIRAQGEFALDGKTVKSGQLQNALHALTNSNEKVCIEVSSVKGISYEDERALIREFQRASISCVGISGIDR